ncbi:MAG: glucose 1-dehydrogenase [Proteobacteria bacterium]|nr:glucose 1-dehydrogenase [Pseudomonadota bacterium]
MGRLDGKVALVSGAARGLGEGVARRFVAEGASVVLGDVLEAEGRAVAEEIGEAAHFVPLDVCSEDAWARAVDVSEALGGLDVLVNNAAIIKFRPLLETSLEDYRRIVEVNQVGCFLGIQAAGRAMVERGRGSIVNISSSQGLVGATYLMAYVASKFAVTGMTKTAAIELGPHGIRVNSVHPAGIETAMTDPGLFEGLPSRRDVSGEYPLKLNCTPDEIAQMVVFLASDESSHSTGSEFVCDGGWLAGSILG